MSFSFGNAGRTTMMGLNFLRDRGGNIAMLFALVVPLFLMAGAVAIDFLGAVRQREALQETADAVATRAAREFLLENATKSQIESAAAVIAQSRQSVVGAFQFTSKADTAQRSISVSLSQSASKPRFLPLPTLGDAVSVTATAMARGTTNVCIVALDPDRSDTLAGANSAKLKAPTCAMLSNSKHASGVNVSGSAKFEANLICSAGGAKGGSPNYTMMPLTDCPELEDPLKDRPAPAVGACDFNDFAAGAPPGPSTVMSDLAAIAAAVSADGSNPSTLAGHKRFELTPGVYCGGIRLNPEADAHLAPGEYIIKGGPLHVGMGARLFGKGVGFYLADDQALVQIDPAGIAHLTAPTHGALAGLLFHENRSNSLGRTHRIYSSNARTLLGTIYLPRGDLEIQTLQPIADQSAYTALVVRRLKLAGSPTLTLNTDYAATDVPTPDGIGPTGGEIVLRN